jgi:hypothetical protein
MDKTSMPPSTLGYIAKPTCPSEDPTLNTNILEFVVGNVTGGGFRTVVDPGLTVYVATSPAVFKAPLAM